MPCGCWRALCGQLPAQHGCRATQKQGGVTRPGRHVARRRMLASGPSHTHTPPCCACAALLARRLTAHYVLNHPHVVKMKDVFVSEDGCLNKVMEFVSGGSLLQHVNGLITKHGGHVPEDKARWVAHVLSVIRCCVSSSASTLQH